MLPSRLVIFSIVCAILLIVVSITVICFQNLSGNTDETQISRLLIFHLSDFMLPQLKLDIQSMRQSGLLITDELDPLMAEEDMIQEHVRLFLTMIVLLLIEHNSSEPFIIISSEDFWYYENERLLEYLNIIATSVSNVDLIIIPTHEDFGTFYVQQHPSKEQITLRKNCILRPFQSFTYKPKKRGVNPKSFSFAIRTSSILKKIFRCFPIVKPIEQTLFLHFNSYILDEKEQSRFEKYSLSKSILAQTATMSRPLSITTLSIRPVLIKFGLISSDKNHRIRSDLYRNLNFPRNIPYFGFDSESLQYVLSIQYFIQNTTLPPVQILLYLNFIFIFLRQCGNAKYVCIFLDANSLAVRLQPSALNALNGFIESFQKSESVGEDMFDIIIFQSLQFSLIRKTPRLDLPIFAILVRVDRVFANLFRLLPIDSDLFSALSANFNTFYI